VLRPHYPIQTARLVLRPFVPNDFRALHDLESRPDVARYLYWEPWTEGDTRDGLSLMVLRTTIEHEGDRIQLAVQRRDSGAMIGAVNLAWTNERHRQGEIGYILHPEHHGQGFATEAAMEMLRLGFEGLRLHRIVARCDARNTPSTRVMERMGMRREAHLRENEFVKGEWADELIYAMLEGEWHAKASSAG